jgi:hypothetical protein
MECIRRTGEPKLVRDKIRPSWCAHAPIHQFYLTNSLCHCVRQTSRLMHTLRIIIESLQPTTVPYMHLAIVFLTLHALKHPKIALQDLRTKIKTTSMNSPFGFENAHARHALLALYDWILPTHFPSPCTILYLVHFTLHTLVPGHLNDGAGQYCAHPLPSHSLGTDMADISLVILKILGSLRDISV